MLRRIAYARPVTRATLSNSLAKFLRQEQDFENIKRPSVNMDMLLPCKMYTFVNADSKYDRILLVAALISAGRSIGYHR